MLPTERTLKVSLESSFVNTKKVYLDENDDVNLCCRSLHKCDAHKHIEINQMIEWNVRNCECVNLFKKCLRNLKTKLSNDLAFRYSMDTTKCYAKEHPIANCVKTEAFSKEEQDAEFLKFLDPFERGKLLYRCSKYKLDQSQPRKLQLFDLTFNYYQGICLSISVPCFCF